MRRFRQSPSLLLLALLLAAGGASPAAAIRIGPPRPVCDEVIELEGILYLEVFDGESAETRYLPVQSGSSDPVVLLPERSYRITLKAGAVPEAPEVPAFYRLEPRSVLTLTAHGEGEEVLPLEREFSINAITHLAVHTGSPGRRKMFLRLSECYEGGSRFFHHPAETLVPLVVVPRRLVPPAPAGP